MKRIIVLSFCAFCASAAFAEQLNHWEYDATAKTVTDGTWTFAATLDSKGNFTFGCVDTNYTPTVVTNLDFTKPITGIEGTYQVTKIDTQFAWNNWTPYQYAAKPIGKMVGKIKIPSTVTQVAAYAFKGCSEATLRPENFPTNVSSLGNSSFYYVSIPGDLVLPYVTKLDNEVFASCKSLTSLTVGDKLTNVTGAYGDGVIGGSSALTNVMFDAAANVKFESGFTFANCTALGPELDLSCATEATIGNSRISNHYGYIQGCTALKRVVFSPKLTKLGRTTLYLVNDDKCNLEEVHFAGNPPVIAANTGSETTDLKFGKDKSVVMSYVHLDTNDVNYAAQLAAWGAYCEGGVLNSSNSMWKTEYVGSVSRPLRLYVKPTVSIVADCDASALAESKGRFIISRSADVGTEPSLTVPYSVGGTAVAGTNYVALSGSATIPAGTNCVAVEVTPIYEEACKTNKTLILTLADGSYQIASPASASITIVNGARYVGIERGADADEGDGRIGSFIISRGADDPTEKPLAVAFTIGGTAIGGQTYATLPTSVVIPAGESSVKLEVVPLFDATIAEDSTVVLTLAPGQYTRTEGKREATVKIINGESYGAWVFTPNTAGSTAGTLSDNNGWVFEANIDKNRGRINVSTVHTNATEIPVAIAPLDFSKFIISSESTNRYFVYQFNPQFGQSLDGSHGWARVGRQPASDLLGKLTLPGEGLDSVLRLAFCCCTNASGTISFPSTLTKIESEAFRQNTFVIDGESFPDGLTSITGNAFIYGKFTGPVDITRLTEVEAGTFAYSDITEVKFGPGLTLIKGGWSAGGFYGCASLTNVIFDHAARFQCNQSAFAYCTALKEIDFYGLTTNANTSIDWSQDILSRCTALKKVTFGPDFDCMKVNNMFSSCTVLEEVRFLGLPPVGFVFPWLNSLDRAQYVKTVIPAKRKAEENSAGKCWNDYCAQDEVQRKKTTWSTDYLPSNVTSAYIANRPLVTDEIPPGLMLILR